MIKKNIKKELTCFYSDGVEYQTCMPIAKEAERRGYKVSFTNNKHQKAEIGLYCQHVAYPKNSKFSVVMLHDMAQGHGNWPNIWRKEPWSLYDLGILPGPAWEKRWQQSVEHPFAHPRMGVIRGGWPKADSVRSKINDKKAKANIRRKLGLNHERVILYAPSWENDGKQDEFVKSLMNLDVDLLLKQAPWSPESHKFVVDNIEEMNNLHRGIAPNVHIIDRDTNIFDCIMAADLIVSEESSVMFEGLLMGVPSIAVTDWMVPDQIPSRLPSIPYDFVVKTPKLKLRETVEKVFNDYLAVVASIESYKNENFYDIQNSAADIMNEIDKLFTGKSFNTIIPSSTKRIIPIKDIANRYYLKYYYSIRRLGGHILRKLNLR